MFLRLLSLVTAQLPSQCTVCHIWPSHPVCDACAGQFGQPEVRCDRCALPVPAGVSRCSACRLDGAPLDACFAAVGYRFPWAQGIAQFKFHQQTGWAATFAALLRSTPWVEAALERADWVLPIPLSEQRLKARGYNQSLLLAQHLARKKALAHVLLRIQDTPAQNTLDRAQRLLNLARAFAVDPLHLGQIDGRRIVLVDDVMTTGATLHAAARCLRQAGAAHITALVVARTDAPD